VNIEKLGPSSSIRDFEWFINKEVQNLERFASDMRKRRGMYQNSSTSPYSRSLGTSAEEFFLGFYMHMESLKSLIDQMRDAEEIIEDMEDDDVEQAYARGELNALKTAFAVIAKQVYLSSERWIDLEAQSGRYGKPELSRELFYTVAGPQKVASPHPLMSKPFQDTATALMYAMYPKI
jgi:hypothetical protein